MNYTDLDRSILKCLITNKKQAIEFSNECDYIIFSSDVWHFAKSVLSYIKTYKDTPTLRVLEEQLKNPKQIDYVKSIWNDVSSFSYDNKQFKFDLEKLKSRFAEKQISQFQESIKNSDKIDVGKTLQDMHKVIHNIKDINGVKAYESRNIKDYLPTFVEKYNAKKDNPNIDKGIMTGYSFFDYATNGVKPADFVVIAGESGFGKSLFLNNIAIQIWMQQNTLETVEFSPGKDIIYFSLEMPYEDCFNRLISRLSGVPSRNIENGKLNKEEFQKIKKALDFIKKYPHQFKIVDIADACANDLESIMIENGDEVFDALFVDYLGIMNPNEKSDESDWLKQGQISYEVRAIARKYKIPAFSAAQLNRKSQSKDPADQVGQHRLARSSTLITHCTHVIQIESRQNEERYPDFIYHFIKNRKGPKGKGSLLKNLSCASLLDKNDEIPEYKDYFIEQNDISEDLEDLELEGD